MISNFDVSLSSFRVNTDQLYLYFKMSALEPRQPEQLVLLGAATSCTIMGCLFIFVNFILCF